MHNRILTFTLLTIFTSLFATTLLSVDYRTNGKRIHSIERYSSDYISNNSTTLMYYYNDSNTALIDSVSEHRINNQNIASDSVYTYIHSFETMGNLKYINYTKYANHTSIPRGTYAFIINAEGKLIQSDVINLSATGETTNRYFRYIHYNNSGKPDSLFYSSSNINHQYTHKYLFSYDASDRLCQVLDYSFNGSLWILAARTQQLYDIDAQPYDNPIQILNYGIQSLQFDIDNLYLICDEQYLPQTIISQYWTGSEWVDSYYMYEAFMSDDWICICSSTADIYSGTSIYSFSYQGLYGGYSFGTPASEYSEGQSVIWEDYTPNEDEYQQAPPATINIKAYPNPFRTSLNIAFTGKDKAPADVSIYNIKGQLVRSWKNTKTTELNWDGKDLSNQPVSCGVYLIKAQQGKSVICRKVIKF